MRLTRRNFLSALGAGAVTGLPSLFSACNVGTKAGATTSVSSLHPQFSPPAQATFPKGFFWGTATASYQIEGAWKADGKGESIWDRFSHTPGKIKNGDTGDVACDYYHRWRDDIALMRAMDLNTYRFSIAWPRIQPSGTGAANQQGPRLSTRAGRCAARGQYPAVRHALPLGSAAGFEDAGGWPNRDMADRYADYVQLMAQALGDRVSDWMLFNEPDAFTDLGYLEGTHAPGHTSIFDFLRATHVVNLAQGAGFRALKAARPSARVGTAFSMSPCEPATNSEADKLAAQRAHAITNTWFLEPALHGKYADALTFLPETAMGIKSGDMEKTRAPLDFLGINLYYRTIASAPGAMERAAHAQEWLFPVKMEGGHEGPMTDIGWEVWPKSLYDMVMRITRDYNRPVLDITESGCAYNEAPDANGVVHDARRISYHQGYLAALAQTMQEGADVRGYHAWSLLDNFEWAEGFSQRFGFTYVDYKTQKRTMKESGKWYAKVAAENRVQANS